MSIQEAKELLAQLPWGWDYSLFISESSEFRHVGDIYDQLQDLYPDYLPDRETLPTDSDYADTMWEGESWFDDCGPIPDQDDEEEVEDWREQLYFAAREHMSAELYNGVEALQKHLNCKE